MTRSGAKLVQAGFYSVAVEAGLRTLSLPKLAGLLGLSVREGPGAASEATADDVASSARATDAWLRHWPAEGRCLRRSLVLGAMLRRHRPVLRIGVSLDRGALRAHAWVEVAGRKVAESPSGGFRALR